MLLVENDGKIGELFSPNTTLQNPVALSSDCRNKYTATYARE